MASPLRVTRTHFGDETLRTWWTRLHASGAVTRGTCFQSWEWNATWSTIFVDGHPHRSLLLLRIDDASGIAGVLPLFEQRRSIGPLPVWRYVLFLADGLSPYPSMITAREDARPLWRAAADHLAGTRPDAWLELRDQYDLSASEGCASAARQVCATASEPSFHLDLAGFPEPAWMAARSASMRRSLRRAERAAHGADVAWAFVRGGDPALRAEARRLSIARFGARSFFSWEENGAFFDRLDAEDPAMRHAVLRLGGATAGILTGFLHAETFYYWLAGNDPAHAAERPGLLNLYLLFRHLAGAGVRRFDFLRGGERYKREFQPEESRPHNLTVIPRRARLRLRIARAAQSLRRHGAGERA